MFFPIGDDQVRGGHRPLLSYGLILLNCLVFLFEFSLDPAESESFISRYGAVPQDIIAGNGLHSLISCMFLHAGWMHLIGNMLFLWVFADNIEAVIGTVNFIVFYLAGGIVATAVHVFFNPLSDVPMVGASGAISAVLGAYMVMFPSSRIKVLILLFFSVTYVRAVFFLGIWIAQQLVAGFGTINETAQEASGVAWWAHIGGFVFGLLSGFVMRSEFRNRYVYGEE